MAYSTVSKSTNFFNTVRYAGTGSELAVTGVSFAPNFSWLKNASATGNHQLYDTLRGAGEVIYSNATTLETTVTQQLTSFDADGYTIGTDGSLNTNGQTFASWNFKAGTTTGVSGGTITPTGYSINTTSKFGIYTWAGTSTAGTIAHGLGGTPTMIIVKNLSSGAGWQVFHQALGPTKVMYLNSNSNFDTSSSPWNNTAPTDTTFALNNDTSTNATGSNYVAYVWCDVPGYQLAASYLGNGQAIGSYIACGFKPTFVLTKRYGTTEDWTIQTSVAGDAIANSNAEYNPTYNFYLANNDAIPGAGGNPIDFYSTGFKLRTSSSYTNADNGTYLYLAIGQPIVGSTNVITTAR